MISDVKLAESAEFKETFNWHDLFFYLDNKLVIPIIGSGLFIVKDPETGKKVLLYEYMHHELCKGMDEARRDEDYWEFMEKNKKSIPTHIKVFLNNVQSKIDTSPLIKLAQITDFQYYICMTYDNFFEPVLRAERCNAGEQIETIDFSINNNASSLVYEDKRTVATIFNIMGSINKINGFAKTEEEVLEHLYSLSRENQFTTKFFSNIEEKHLLFIGCNLPDWLLRFMIRIITRERLNDANITKIIADRTTANDKKLCLFLNHFNSSIFHLPNSTSLEFVDEMYSRWKAGKPTGSVGKIKYPGVVFLSYSSDDRDAFVEELYQKLVLKGVNVFYDKNKLDAGDYFTQKIKKAITDCSLFIPLISKNSLDPERYAINEWNTAMNMEQYFIDSGMKELDDTSFIKPFTIDDTMPNDSRIQKIFKHISVQSENDIDKIVDLIIANLDK
jgi:hypothetical protein